MEITSFEEFWPFYVGEHRLKMTRVFHFVGTTGGFVVALTALTLKQPLLLPLAIAVGYAPAWISHFFIEGNKPASWKYPWWSFKADMVMWSKMLLGKMDQEVERVLGAKA